MATQKDAVASTLKLYRVASIITGTLLVVITVLFALRLASNQELWFGGPHGFLSLEHFAIDDLGGKIGLPTTGVDVTKAVLIVHGWCYMLYLYSDYRLWSQMRWTFTRFLIIAAGGVVPLLSFFTEAHYHRVAVAQNAAASAGPLSTTPSEA